MYDRIVVALDGSARGERVLEQAAGLAERLATPLHLVRVADLAWLRMGQGGGPSRLAEVSAELAEERHQADAYLSALAEGLRERHRGRGLAVTTETRAGMAARELVALAGRGDLLVMSSHGRTGPARWLLGSVAEEVVRQAPCPVLLVRAGA